MVILQCVKWQLCLDFIEENVQQFFCKNSIKSLTVMFAVVDSAIDAW